MTQAKCFNCGISLDGIGKSMEELIKDEFPIFCSIKCSEEFSTDKKEIKKQLKQLLKDTTK